MRKRNAQLAELVDLLYRSATDKDCLAQFWRALGRASGECSLMMLMSDLRRGSSRALYGPLDPNQVATYDKYFAHRNDFLKASPSLRKVGAVEVGNEHLLPGQLERSAFYNEYMRPLGIHWCLGSCIASGPTGSAFIVAARKYSRPFDRRDVSLHRELNPHLRRWHSIRERLGALELERDAACHALNNLPDGVVLLDGEGSVLIANSGAKAHFAASDGLQLEDGRVHVGDPRARRAYEELIANASACLDEDRAPGGWLRVPRLSGQRDYHVLVSPFRVAGDADSAPRKVSVALFVVDPEAVRGDEIEGLLALFDLTNSEIRVACLLLEGFTVKGCAGRLGITQETVRTHVKRILAKTGTHRQTDLLRLIGGAARLGRGRAMTAGSPDVSLRASKS